MRIYDYLVLRYLSLYHLLNIYNNVIKLYFEVTELDVINSYMSLLNDLLGIVFITTKVNL